ncbi:Type 1 glutamine amidotransferase-like domain-containing protein [Longimicrobium sp.]|uniref:Type 1 glutamine amidotransferase-like domain-containing protein n=1 Tax=Longimicrobium sp. TaxID=2029185 RepID=UPI003B3A58B8
MPPITQGQIVAFGGGGFAMEPDNPLLDDYILSLTGKDRPRVCLIPTASGDNAAWVDRFYELFTEDRCEPSHLALFSRSVDDLYAFLSEQDVIYASGGNTVNLLAVWRAQGLAEVLPRVLAQGTIACGVSAGALCWFERGITDSYGPGLNPLENGLGFLSGSFCPHYDSDPRRPFHYPEYVRKTGVAGTAVEDGVALHYVDGQLRHVVSSRPAARAWRMTPEGERVRVELVQPEYLGANS